jgi:hypothetical protein
MTKKTYDEAPLSQRMEPEFEHILDGGTNGGSTSYSKPMPGRRGVAEGVDDLQNMNPVRKSTGHGPIGR